MNDIVFNPKVISIIRDEFIKMEPHFSDMRRAAQSWGEHPDWPWNGFVLSYATLGGSLNWEKLSLIHISEPTRPVCSSRMPSSA